MVKAESAKTSNHITFDDAHCCACGACMSACPNQAIYMSKNAEGFLYPEIDSQICTECGLCKTVCRYQFVEEEISKKETYAAVANDVDLEKSASGGIFATRAASVLAAGGIVVGCSMHKENGEFKPKHICIDCLEELDQLKGSKYVQSYTGTIYQDVKSLLDQGRTVLFSGTPCQVAGLYGYVGKDYANLYTIDTICHGVPSESFFNSYIRYTEKKLGNSIIDYRFRDKTNGWQLSGSMTAESINGKTQEILFKPEESSYYQLFLNSSIYRENCYSCPYASERRPGDVTIGDYWCIDLVHPDLIASEGGPLSTYKGVSCLIINLEKGSDLINHYGTGISKWDSEYRLVTQYKRQLEKASTRPEWRDEVFLLYRSGYSLVEKWYQKRLAKLRIERKIRQLVPIGIKRLIKRLNNTSDER